MPVWKTNSTTGNEETIEERVEWAYQLLPSCYSLRRRCNHRIGNHLRVSKHPVASWRKRRDGEITNRIQHDKSIHSRHVQKTTADRYCNWIDALKDSGSSHSLITNLLSDQRGMLTWIRELMSNVNARGICLRERMWLISTPIVCRPRLDLDAYCHLSTRDESSPRGGFGAVPLYNCKPARSSIGKNDASPYLFKIMQESTVSMS